MVNTRRMESSGSVPDSGPRYHTRVCLCLINSPQQYVSYYFTDKLILMTSSVCVCFGLVLYISISFKFF